MSFLISVHCQYCHHDQQDLACLQDLYPKVWGRLESHCCSGVRESKTRLLSAAGSRVAGGISYWQGCLQSSQSSLMVAQKWLLLLSNTEAYGLPQVLSTWFGQCREASCISKGFWVRPFFFKSFFSLSSSSYLAACPTGTTLMQVNGLDGPFYEQAKWRRNPFCPRLPANQQ